MSGSVYKHNYLDVTPHKEFPEDVKVKYIGPETDVAWQCVSAVELRDALTKYIDAGFKLDRPITIMQSELDALKDKIKELEGRA